MNKTELQCALGASLSWRKRELQQARFLAEEATDANQAYLCRAWIMVMYAHCDQYIKEVSRFYLEHLRAFPRNAYDYWSVWQAFHAKKLMLSEDDTQKYASVLKPRENNKSDLINAIMRTLDSGSFEYKRLRFIADFVLQVRFDCPAYKGFCTTLKEKRNEIAHGEPSYVRSVQDCVAWHKPTLSLLQKLTDAVLDAACTRH